MRHSVLACWHRRRSLLTNDILSVERRHCGLQWLTASSFRRPVALSTNRHSPRVLWDFRGATPTVHEVNRRRPRHSRPLVQWSWGESNPRPMSGDRPCYDHSRDCGSTVTALPGQLSLRSPPDLSPVPTVFPVASGL